MLTDDGAAGNDIETNSLDAADILRRIETEHGQWWSYGGDGRLTTEPAVRANRYTEEGGAGWRARFTDGPYGGDYGWGPLASSEMEATVLFLAELFAALEADRA